MASPETSRLALPVLFNQLSRELGALHLMAADMESAVDGMIERHAGVLDARSIQDLQLLDILSQTLQALAGFSANAALLSAPDWTLDGRQATAGLKLASLAQRLACGGDVHAAKPAAETYELFSDG
jgi:hypothetical protein